MMKLNEYLSLDKSDKKTINDVDHYRLVCTQDFILKGKNIKKGDLGGYIKLLAVEVGAGSKKIFQK